MKKILIYTFHKSASVFLHKLTSDVTDMLNIDYHSINHENHFDLIKSKSWNYFIETNNRTLCFGPIRIGEAEPNIPENIESYSVILHLRDPRDVLTSLFFSQLYSHSRKNSGFNPSNDQINQWQKDGIDKYITDRVPLFKKRYEIVCNNLLNRKNTIFIKYRDMVYNYGQWLDEFLSAFYLSNSSKLSIFNPQTFSLKLQKREIHKKLYEKYRAEFQVESENIYKHKRQITPGDYKRKLSPETIGFLNSEFRDILKQLKFET